MRRRSHHSLDALRGKGHGGMNSARGMNMVRVVRANGSDAYYARAGELNLRYDCGACGQGKSGRGFVIGKTAMIDGVWRMTWTDVCCSDRCAEDFALGFRPSTPDTTDEDETNGHE